MQQSWPRVYRLCLGLLGDPAAAEEASQQAFYQAWQAWDGFEGRSRADTWLYRIALNVCRRSYGRTSACGLADGMDSVEGPGGESTQLERSERQERVRRALGRLPEPQREVLSLFYLDGLSGKDLADLLDCPLGTVWSRLHHARQALEDIIRNEFEDLIA